MLGKMLKHELKATWRYLAMVNVAAILVALIGKLGLLAKASAPDYIIYIYGFFYVLLLFAASTVTVVILATRFYRNLYAAEGYLTNTLPVTTGCKLNAKILNSFFWLCINTICVLLSIMIFTTSLIELSEIRIFIGDWFKYYLTILGTSSQTWGIIYLLITSIISALYSILMLFVSISIGCAFNSHKILASVITYMLNYVMLQTISIIMMAFSGFFNDLTNMAIASRGPSYTPIISWNLQVGGVLLTLICSVVYYVVCHYMLSRKLNLN